MNAARFTYDETAAVQRGAHPPVSEVVLTAPGGGADVSVLKHSCGLKLNTVGGFSQIKE